MSNPTVDPRESLETIRRTLGKVRRYLFFSCGPVYRVWGLAWLVAFMLTYLAEQRLLAGFLQGTAMGLMWVVVTGVAGLYTVLYFRQQPIRADIGTRFGLAWPAAFVLMGFTVGSLAAAGLPLHGVEFGIFAVHTVAVIYLVTGAVLLDNLQITVGLWFGLSNIIALQLGLPTYALTMGVMGGGGLIVAGLIADRLYRAAGDGR